MMKAEYEVTDRSEMNMIRWMCSVTSKKEEKRRARWIVWIDTVSLVVKIRRLRWFGHVESKDVDWVMTMELMELRRGTPEEDLVERRHRGRIWKVQAWFADYDGEN